MCIVNIFMWAVFPSFLQFVTCQPLVRSPKHAVCSPGAPSSYACVFADGVNSLESK